VQEIKYPELSFHALQEMRKIKVGNNNSTMWIIIYAEVIISKWEDREMAIIKKRIYKLSTITLILASFIPIFLISKSAECAMADSQMIFPSGKAYLREIDTEKVRRALENKIVAERLRAYGLSKGEVIAKMAKMGDGQIHQLASISDRLPAGGASASVFVATTIVLVAIIVTLVIAIVVAA
jgi:hypothetical protein